MNKDYFRGTVIEATSIVALQGIDVISNKSEANQAVMLDMGVLSSLVYAELTADNSMFPVNFLERGI